VHKQTDPDLDVKEPKIYGSSWIRIQISNSDNGTVAGTVVGEKQVSEQGIL